MTGPGASPPSRDPAEVAAAVRRRDVRALARAVSWLESDDPRGPRVLAEVRREANGGDAAPPDTRLIGITGSPGSGKSTLVDRMVEHDRERGLRVAVIAVDPTSPYSGGAILGDRIRMMRWHADPDVFVRSMATRGQLGGLAAATLRVAALLEAAGFDRVLIETVGVGQSEVDVVDVADSTVLVLTPGGGDAVQAFKAGVMEIADVFVVNKSDLPGADRVRREIRAAQGLAEPDPDGWSPPVTLTRAHDGVGVDELNAELDAHHAWLAAHGGDAERRRRRVRAELAAAVRQRAQRALHDHADEVLPSLAAGATTAERAAAQILAAWTASRAADDDTVGSEP